MLFIFLYYVLYLGFHVRQERLQHRRGMIDDLNVGGSRQGGNSFSGFMIIYIDDFGSIAMGGILFIALILSRILAWVKKKENIPLDG